MGETKGRREAMDRFTAQLVQHGNKPDYAKKLAIENAIKADQRDAKKRRKGK